jgi:hypothetical protein
VPELTTSVSLPRHTIPSVEEKGEEFDLWRLTPPVDQPQVPVAMTEQDALETVSHTMEIIKENGFCLWTCHQLGGAVICIVKDPGASYPRGYPLYTIDELLLLSNTNLWTERMVLEAKRVAGAVVAEVLMGECAVELGEEA